MTSGFAELQGELGGGTTSTSSGLIGLLKFSHVETKLSQISKDLYAELEEKGYDTGWKNCGSLFVAQTRERMDHFRRLKSEAHGRGIECSIVDNRDGILEKCSLVKADDLIGGLWVPEDGVANPVEICCALALEADSMGVKILQNTELLEVQFFRCLKTSNLTPRLSGCDRRRRRERRED